MGAAESNETMSDNTTDWELAVEEALKCDVDELQTTSFYLLIPASIVILLFMLMEVRKSFQPNCCGGHFAIIVPFNLIENKTNRLPYIAVFTLISLSAAKVFTSNSSELIGIFTRDAFGIILLKLLYIVIICVIFFPIFASCTTKNIISLFLGVGYSVAFMIVKTYHIFTKLEENKCDLKALSPHNTATLLLFLILTFGSGICFIVCQLMRISFKLSECKEKKKIEERINLPEKEVTDYAKLYTNHLLSSSNKEVKVYKGRKKVLLAAAHKMHPNIPGFRYSLGILSSITMAVVIIFYFASIWGIHSFYLWMSARRFVRDTFGGENETISAANIFLYLSNTFLLKNKGKIDQSIQMSIYDYLQEQLTIVFLSNIAAIVIAFVSICIISVHMLKCYRKDMKKLFRSQAITKHLNESDHVQLLVYANRYVGYQVAYFFWGFLLQFFCIWLFLTVIAFIIIFPLVHGMWSYLAGFIYSFAPTMVMMYVIYFAQYFLIKYLFVQDRGKYLALDNRRGFMNLMYFFLFYNMFIGLFSCLKRIIKSMIFGLIFIPRLDKSIMPKSFEKYDPGFKSYICLLKLEAIQTNPILMTFLSELYKEGKKRRVSIIALKLGTTEESKAAELKCRRRMIARTRWFLAWTLIFNPTLQIDRWNRDRLRSRFDIIVVPRNDPLITEVSELDTTIC